jgi:5'-nucleotidase
LSLQLDLADYYSKPYQTLADVPNATAIANQPADIGYAVVLPGAPATFVPHHPNVLLYTGNTPDSQLAGVAWHILGAEPEGFPGERDVWSESAPGEWWLNAWVVRGHEYDSNVFAPNHPCLLDGGPRLNSTQDQCFRDSHLVPLEIVVTNDDGYAAPGIGALVDGLKNLDPPVTIHVVAPFANQSGSSDQTTQPPHTLSASSVTVSGLLGTAISSTDLAAPRNGSGSPADTVLYALNTLHLSPEIVLSGINTGQNIGFLSSLSGTVGAARMARRNYVAGIASSQGGFSAPNDFPAGVAATLALLEEWRLGRTVNTHESVLGINIPTCAPGSSIRGTLQTVVAPTLGSGQSYVTQDCTSTVPVIDIHDDIDAFNNGFIGITDLGLDQPSNWPQ